MCVRRSGRLIAIRGYGVEARLLVAWIGGSASFAPHVRSLRMCVRLACAFAPHVSHSPRMCVARPAVCVVVRCSSRRAFVLWTVVRVVSAIWLIDRFFQSLGISVAKPNIETVPGV